MQNTITYKLVNKPGWEWTKAFLKAEVKLYKMIKPYKASQEQTNIKFGFEVPRNKHALAMDLKNGNGKWEVDMKTEIDQFNDYKKFRVLADDEAIAPG